MLDLNWYYFYSRCDILRSSLSLGLPLSSVSSSFISSLDEVWNLGLRCRLSIPLILKCEFSARALGLIDDSPSYVIGVTPCWLVPYCLFTLVAAFVSVVRSTSACPCSFFPSSGIGVSAFAGGAVVTDCRSDFLWEWSGGLLVELNSSIPIGGWAILEALLNRSLGMLLSVDYTKLSSIITVIFWYIWAAQ